MLECMQVAESPEARIFRIRFSMSDAGSDRVHYVTEEDIRAVLSRLPGELWHRLRAVHFNDRSRGARVLGYVNEGHRENRFVCAPPTHQLDPFFGEEPVP